MFSKTAKTSTRYSGLDSMKQDIHPKGLIIHLWSILSLLSKSPKLVGQEIIISSNYPKAGWSVDLNDSPDFIKEQ